MKINFEILKKLNDENWDRRVESVPEGTWRQTSYAAHLRSKTWRDKPIYVVAKNEKGNIIAQCLMFSNFSSPAHLLRMPLRLLSPVSLPLAQRFLRVYNWRYGPLIFDRKNYCNVLDEFLKFINKIAKNSCYQIREIHPPLHDIEVSQEDIKSIYLKNGYTAKEYGTVLINLRQDLHELQSRMKKGSRYDIRKASRDGVIISKVATAADIKKYYRLLRNWSERNRVDKPIFSIVKKNCKYANEHNRSAYFLAKHNGRVIAGLGANYFNGIIFQGGVATSDYAIEKKLFGNHLLNWHIMEWGHKKDFRYFDLTWLDPNPKTPQEEGLYRFKTRWGGDIIKYYIYTKIFSDKKNSLSKVLKKIYRKKVFSGKLKQDVENKLGEKIKLERVRGRGSSLTFIGLKSNKKRCVIKSADDRREKIYKKTNEKLQEFVYMPPAERFKKEFELLNTLSAHGLSPRPLFFSDTFLVREYVEGDLLSELFVSKPYKLDKDIQDALNALIKMHSLGVCHGDPRPDNILVTRSGIVFLDFEHSFASGKWSLDQQKAFDIQRFNSQLAKLKNN